MAREQAAGAIVVDRLRERIVSGVYLGFWHAGQRLPSIRAIADSENVDRKTVAAAYRRLETEGLVRVHARSGVYLRPFRLPDGAGPLERLYKRWLENTYERANALGLDSRTILRLITAVAEIERMALPVVECDEAQAETLSGELRQRLSLNAVPLVIGHNGWESAFNDVPFVITTPYHRNEVAARSGDRPIVEVTLSVEAVRELNFSGTGSLCLVVASQTIGQKISRALERGQLVPQSRTVTVVCARHTAQLLEETVTAEGIFLWPGTPQWARDALRGRPCISPVNCLSEESVARVRSAVLEAAIRRAHDRARNEDATSSSGGEARLSLGVAGSE